MRLISLATTAVAVLALAACQQNADTTADDAMSAEDAAVDASATSADGSDAYGATNADGSASTGGNGGAGGSRAASGSGSGSANAVERTGDPSVDGYVADPRGPRLADGSYADDSYGDARDTAQSDAEKTNLRPRPDLTGPQ